MGVIHWHLSTVYPWTNTSLQRDVLRCHLRTPLLTCLLGTPMPNFLFSSQHYPLYPPLWGNYSFPRNNSAVVAGRARSAVGRGAEQTSSTHGVVPRLGPASQTGSAQANQSVRTHRRCLHIKHHLHPRTCPRGLPLQGLLRGERVWARHRKPPLLWEPESRLQKRHRFKCLWLPVRTVPAKGCFFWKSHMDTGQRNHLDSSWKLLPCYRIQTLWLW